MWLLSTEASEVQSNDIGLGDARVSNFRDLKT